jgi:hypothetical protein
VHRSLALAAAVLLVAGLSSAAAVAGRGTASGAPTAKTRTVPVNRTPVDAGGAAVAAPEVAATTVVPPPAPHPSGPVSLAGCPPPPSPPRQPSTPWHPAVLVPDAALPAPAPPTDRAVPLSPLRGKGMWLWKFGSTEHGDADAIVTKAQAAGLNQLWVRVGDSKDGFYAADVLEKLVPRAHAQGIAVIGWGFPYLYDPVGDGAWTTAAVDWQSSSGDRLDAFSPDMETASEGVAVSDRRVQVYLGQVAQAMGDRPLVATVFRPTDRLWATYPYGAIAPYVDGFAPMVYWGCTEPGAAAAQALQRLAAMRPVHLIGQAYNMGDEGGRQVSPSADETWRFLDVAQSGGALGASFWSWQEIDQEQWTAMAGFPWQAHGFSVGRS